MKYFIETDLGLAYSAHISNLLRFLCTGYPLNVVCKNLAGPCPSFG